MYVHCTIIHIYIKQNLGNEQNGKIMIIMEVIN